MSGPTSFGVRLCPPMVALFTLVVLACEKSVTAPADSGFLAVVVRAEGPVEVSPGDRYRLRIRELSGTLGINDTLYAAPNDTILIPYPLATYDVFVDNVPIACIPRYGFGQRARISAPGNTSIARFNIYCSSLLTIQVLTDGWMLDDAYVWRVVGPGAEQSGLAESSDTVRLDNITAGLHTVELAHIAPNCIVLSSQGRQASLTITPPVAQLVSFRVRCSDPARAPQFLHFEGNLTDGAAAWYAEVYDPDRDLDSYTWTITDCAGHTLFADVGATRRGLGSGRTAGADTVRVAASMFFDKPPDQLERRCSKLHFTDGQGNTTAIEERRFANRAGAPPVAVNVNATLVGTRIRTTIQADDPDGDLAGAFVSVRFRDGVLGAANGKPDIGIYNVYGYLPPFAVPDFIVDGRPYNASDVLAIIVDLIDRAGHVTRVTDTNLAQ